MNSHAIRTIRILTIIALIIALLFWIITLVGWFLLEPSFETINTLLSALISTLVTLAGWLSTRKEQASPSGMADRISGFISRFSAPELIGFSVIVIAMIFLIGRSPFISAADWVQDRLVLNRGIPTGYSLWVEIQDPKSEKSWVGVAVPNTNQVVKLFANGEKPTQLDDNRLLFERNKLGRIDIYLADFSTKKLINLTKDLDGNNIDPAISPGKDRIAFASGQENNFDIYVMNLDGSEITNLTSHNADDLAPSWSPDGKYIAFQSNRSGNNQVYFVAVAEKEPVAYALTSECNNVTPAWSWTNGMIAYASNCSGNWDVWVMKPDGSGKQNITVHPKKDWDPSWGEDDKLFFISDRNNAWEVYSCTLSNTTPRRLLYSRMNFSSPTWNLAEPAVVAMQPERPITVDLVFARTVDGVYQIFRLENGALTQLTDLKAYSAYPEWSSDGSQIVFHTKRDGNSEIYIMNADGSNPVNISRNPFQDAEPSWSPDQRRVVWTSNRNANWALYSSDERGEGLQQLTDGKSNAINPDWSPDAGSIVYVDDSDGAYNVWLVHLDGLTTEQLTFDSSEKRNPAFSPDGQFLAYQVYQEGSYDLYIMEFETRKSYRFTCLTEGNEEYPAWSPDGKWLVFTSDRSGKSHLYAAPFTLGCSDETWVSLTWGADARDASPDWRP